MAFVASRLFCMRLVYNGLFAVFFCLAAPFYFWKMKRRGGWKQGFAQRFGIFDGKTKSAITNRHTIWIHAVSVGEVNLATHLISALELRAPNLKVVVSTTTSTGMGELKKKLPSHVLKIYYPIDWPKFVSRSLRIVNPEAIVLVEAEIWPNLLWKASERRIPVFLVNARMSERSMRGYKRFSFLFRSIFRSLAGVGVQNPEDAERLRALGCRDEAVQVLGNMKFDAAQLSERPITQVSLLLRQLGVAEGRPIIVAGSTHDGEEAILAEQYQRLKKRFPDLFLIIVPRHAERAKSAGRDIDKVGLKQIFRTSVASDTRFEPGELECLVVNTTGELRYFYELASIVFIGKSLTAEGGQNPLEPAALGKPIVFGPNMQNFQAITAALLAGQAAWQAADAPTLEVALETLLSNKDRREAMGKAALEVVKRNQGSVERTVEMILKSLDGSENVLRRVNSPPA